MYGAMKDHLVRELASLKEQGLFKEERVIMTPQGADIKVKDGSEVINFCANNYLGLSSHPKVIEKPWTSGVTG
jgi:glycine C-acetyltransferase